MGTVNSRQTRGRSFVVPLLLIAIGVLFLLSNFGLLAWGFWTTILQFWPVILVLFGVELLLGRSRPMLGVIIGIVILGAVVTASAMMSGGFGQAIGSPSAASERVVEELGDLTSARVELEAGAGELVISDLPSESSNLVEADIATRLTGGRVVKSFNVSNGVGSLRLKTEGRPAFLWQGNGGDSWDVKLARNLPLDLRIKTGASSGVLDLTDLTVSDLRIDVGASSVDVMMPSAGSTNAVVKAGAASLNIEIPQTVAARIRAESGLSSINIDQERFPRQGQYYVSSDWDSAADRIELDIDAGVASVTVY